jgi:hypothetical protein
MRSSHSRWRAAFIVGAILASCAGLADEGQNACKR